MPTFSLIYNLKIFVIRNGRWRSKWSITFSTSQSEGELTGDIKSQVHYFEDGNVQLVSNNDVKEQVQIQV